MTKLFVFCIGLWILITYPQVCIIMGIIAYIIYCIFKNQKLKGNKQEPEEDSSDPADKSLYGKFVHDGIIDWEEYNKAKTESLLKPGFRDNPEWQRQSAKIKEHMRQNRIKSDKELREDINEDLNEKAFTFWAKKR